MLLPSATVIAIFLSLVALAKPRKAIPDYLLGILLLVSGTIIGVHHLSDTGLHLVYPRLLVLGRLLPVLVGPLVYLYVKYQTQDIPFRLTDALHGLPYLLINLVFAEFHFLDASQQVLVVEQSGRGFEWQEMSRIWLIGLSGIVYLGLSLYRLLQFRKNLKHTFSNTEKIQFNWLLLLIGGYIVVWMMVLFVADDSATSSSGAVLVVLLGYFGISQVNVFGRDRSVLPPSQLVVQVLPASDAPVVSLKYQSSNLADAEGSQIHQALLVCLDAQQPYLDPELTLQQLAALVGTHPHKLSQIINTLEHKSFYDLINEHRIRTFLTEAGKPHNQRLTFEALAYECGFNSKASFNRNFKKATGQTPSEYLKSRYSPTTQDL